MTTSFSVAPEIVTYAQRFAAKSLVSVTRITDGSINDTYEVKTKEGERFILQKMSSLFKPSVMDNLAQVTPYVVAKSVMIPAGISATTGEAYLVASDDSWYRALTYIPGKTIHDGLSVESALSVGRLVGKFHSALSVCDAHLEVPIPHFHDTKHYVARMSRIARGHTDAVKQKTLMPIVEAIEKHIDTLTVDVTTLPQRIIHADLKVSNVRFSEEGEAIALIDMDTMMRGSVVTEMGDALRSWCGTAGEDSSEQVFDETIYASAMRGYTETAEGVTKAEIDAIPEGIRVLTLELASRFVTDAFEESYFAHRESLYASLYEQCKTKAENQLLFLKAFEEKRGLL
ncbi:MAG: hypothetical protein RLZZ76_555 [Candidatus Parcubacteria bacterium]|jgi:Ser/Thr protein kinase RdoA (MazF antagonist)